MSMNLEAMYREVAKYLESRGIVVFHAYARSGESADAVYWDVDHHPDVREFLAAAEAAGSRIVAVHARELTEDMLDEALEKLEEASFPRDEQRAMESQFKQMRTRVGGMCEVQVSFDVAQRTYIYTLRTDWLEDFHDALDRIEENIEQARREREQEHFGGPYFSRN